MNNVSDWTVPSNHPAFSGHFPGNPTLPGVILLDVALHVITEATGIDLTQCEINAVKFLSPVSPNEQLHIHHVLLETGAIRFEILSNQRKIATGRVINHSSTITNTI